MIAYRAAGVPVHRIFIVSPDGNAFMYNRTFIKTYTDLDEIGHMVFPYVKDDENKADSQYGQISYWSIPPQILIEDLE